MNKRRRIVIILLILLTAVLGAASIYITIQLQNNQSPDTSHASTAAGYTNVCGTTNASWSGRDPSCHGCSPGSCSGSYVYQFICNGYTNQCGGSGTTPVAQSGPSGSFGIGGSCGQSVQVDVFTGPNYSGLTDFFVYYNGDCVNPQPPPPPPPPSCGGTMCGSVCCPTNSGYQCISPGSCAKLDRTCNQTCQVTYVAAPYETCISGLNCYEAPGTTTGYCRRLDNLASTTCSPPPAYTVSAQATCSGSTPQIQASWAKSQDPAFLDYDLQISNNSAFHFSSPTDMEAGKFSMDVNTTTLTGIDSSWNFVTTPISALSPNTTYYVRVQYDNNASVPAMLSNVVSVTTSACTAPQKYSCNTSNYTCGPDVNGTYTDQASCSAACVKPPACPTGGTAKFTVTTYTNGTLTRTQDYPLTGPITITNGSYTSQVVGPFQMNAGETGLKVQFVRSGYGTMGSTTSAPNSGGTSQYQDGTYTIADCSTSNLSNCISGPNNAYTATILGDTTMACFSGFMRTLAAQANTVGCGQTCDSSNVCSSGLACLDGSNNVTTGTGTCKLQSNPTSPTCSPPVTCYRCTAALNDGNTCESTTAATTCPGGYTTNSNCAQAAGGSCPVITTVGCNQPCNPTNNTVCSTGLACLDGSNNVTTGAGTCKLQSNPNSTTCTAAVTVSCGQSCDGINTVCGSGQQCSGGTCKQNSCVANPSSCDVTGCQTLNTVACGQACGGSNLCDTANGYQCSGGTCKLNSCVTTPSSCDPTGCTTITTVTCGQSCDATHVCDNTHTCDNGTCKLNSCISDPSSCNATGCTPLSVCGGSCTTSADCSSGHSCVSGTCILNGCTSGTCTGGCTPLCGGPCTTSADCPTNHTCQSGTCILNGCTPSTCTNGCTPIPNTGILDDARPLLVGILLILAGYLTFKFRIGRNLSLSLIDSDELFREKLEKKLEKKLDNSKL